MSYSNQENIKNERFAQEKERDNKKLDDSSCIINSSKYREGEHVPGAGPCEECICHPPNVVCSMTKCPVNSGCITIQLPNKCCPKYKCDCEHKGKLYNNGEKINKSDESACRVCFCNGGEIVCTSIVCYTRNDCQGYYLPGDCCPKYDNCTSTSSIEQKPRDSMDYEKSSRRNYWPHSTEQNFNVDSIWKRDTTKTQQRELPTVPDVITIPSIFVETEEVPRETNRSLPDDLLEGLDDSTSDSISEKNITQNEPDNELNTPHNLVTDLKHENLNTVEDSITSFLGFDTENSTNEQTTDTSLMINTESSETSPEFEELFDTTDIDSSVIITNQNGTEIITAITETPFIKEIINSSTEMTTSTQVEIFDPSDLILDSKRPMFEEFSTITPEIDPITEIDYDESREATTPRPNDKTTVGTPHKLVMESSQGTIDDDISTENAFTDLEDTTDMFGPNFGHRSYKTETYQILTNMHKSSQQTKGLDYVTSLLPTTDKNFEKKNLITTKPPQNKLLDQSSTKSNIENKISTVNTEFDSDNISVVTNKGNGNNTTNDTYFLELETTNVTVCVNDICTESSKLNEELFDPQTESTTPFIIETKVLSNQEPPPATKRIKYPKEYPAEFETIQNGPSVTITKRTYTSIPDIVYTTTTMITLPTLDLIYKANKDIDKYVNEMQMTTTNKPKTNSNLSPLRNLSSIQFI
ncbi:Hypothetical protein CINCED_3A011291 [Cinara cedri]|nr:Hypothetical protein CINCED_3A011291 [Cinara cedri]